MKWYSSSSAPAARVSLSDRAASGGAKELWAILMPSALPMAIPRMSAGKSCVKACTRTALCECTALAFCYDSALSGIVIARELHSPSSYWDEHFRDWLEKRLNEVEPQHVLQNWHGRDQQLGTEY